MGFDLPSLLATRRGEGYDLHARYLNPQLPRMLHAIGFDKVYERAEGAYLWDRDGNRYADFLAGFGVFGVGHNHPVVRKALHDMLDAELPSMVQFDCALLPGLLAEALLARGAVNVPDLAAQCAAEITAGASGRGTRPAATAQRPRSGSTRTTGVPSGCWPRRPSSTACTSATAAPRRSRPR